MNALRSDLRWMIFPCVALCLLLIPACEEQSLKHPNSTVQPTFQSVQQILTLNCTTASCHSALSRRGDLVLTSDVAYESLVSVLPDNPAARGRGLMRVNPGKPDSSFLLIKLIAPGPEEGDKMPQTGGSLTSQEIDAIRSWIASGAKRD